MKQKQKKSKKESKKSEKRKTNNKRSQNSRNNRGLLVFAVLLIILVLSLVMALRFLQSKPILPQGESYYNLRIAQSLKQDFLLATDPIQKTPYQANPYHYVLAFLFMILPVELASLCLPLLLAVLSSLAFFKLLKILGVKPTQASHALIILCATPAFIIVFSGLYLIGFVLFLSLLVLVLSLHRRNAYQTICVLLFILLALTSIAGFILTLAVLFFILILLKRRPQTLYVSALVSAFLIGILTLFSEYKPKFLGFHSFAFKDILSVLQAGLGFDLFLIVLFSIGFVITWINSKEKKLFHLPVLILLIISFFNSVARVFASFVMACYCVIAINYFFKRKWDLKIIKIGTLLLVLCTLVFSFTNQATMLVNAQPDENTVKTLAFLKELDSIVSAGAVLSSEENGFLVEYYSDKPTVLDSNSFLNQEYNQLKQDVHALFMSARLTDAEPLLSKYRIRYILLTSEMKEELWEGREQGLWFLVRHSESFIRKYNEDDIEIWGYVPLKERVAGSNLW